MQQAEPGHHRLDESDADGDAGESQQEEDVTRPAAHRGGRRHDVEQHRLENEQLHRRAVLDESEQGPAVVENHDLVDHRQLEVGAGIVDRHAAALREQDDEETRGDEQQRRRALEPEAPLRRAQHLGETQRARETRQGQEGEEERRFGQPGETDLACRAHALEGRTGVERRRGREEPAEGEEVGEEDEVAGERDRSGERAERHQQAGEQRRGDRQSRRRDEDPGRGPAERDLLARQFEEVEIGLQEARDRAARRPPPWSG